MTQKQFLMKLDQISSKDMTIERLTDFANTIILAYREDLSLYGLVVQDSLDSDICKQMYAGPSDRRLLVCFSSMKKAKLPPKKTLTVTGYVCVQQLSVREVVDNALSKDVISGLVFNKDSAHPYIVDKEILEPFVKM